MLFHKTKQKHQQKIVKEVNISATILCNKVLYDNCCCFFFCTFSWDRKVCVQHLELRALGINCKANFRFPSSNSLQFFSHITLIIIICQPHPIHPTHCAIIIRTRTSHRHIYHDIASIFHRVVVRLVTAHICRCQVQRH